MSAIASIQTFRNFDNLVSAYPSILAAQDNQDIFYTPEWFKTLSQYGNTFRGKLLLIVIHDKSTNASICLPMSDGDNLDGLSNYYSSLFGPIGYQLNANEDVCQALGQWIFAQPQKWPQINLHPLDTANPFFTFMLPALRMTGYWADSYTCFGNWYLEVAGRNYDNYLASRSSRLRNTIKRGHKKAKNSGKVDIEIHQTPGAALDVAIREYTEIYRKSWKPAESHPDFITKLCQISSAQGWLRLGLLRFNGEARAAQIWLVCANKANIFKLAYSHGENLFSAGTLLTAELMRYVIDVDGVQEVDYLTGDDAYKQDWMSHRRERRGIIAFNPRTVQGLFKGCKHYSGKVIKKLKCSSIT